eukprot:7621828-Pyramimonas_sp.AAC.1
MIPKATTSTPTRPTGWTSKCARGFAQCVLAVWAGGRAEAASCPVILYFEWPCSHGAAAPERGPCWTT